jgi:endonuclease YncB( thermonuclease family)
MPRMLIKPARFLVFVGIICAAPVQGASAAPRMLDAHVIAVADGDSLTVRDSNGLTHGVRLAAIDAPEHGQPYSAQSKSSLVRTALGKDARIEWLERDDYGRLVAKVWVVPADAPCRATPCPRTLDAGLAQVTDGLAWHYKRYERDQALEDQHRYADAETEARARRLGLWQDASAAPPWEWRRGLTNGPVKKSRRNVCHAPDSSTYPTVRHFKSYPTVDACLASGGRLPKPSG